MSFELADSRWSRQSWHTNDLSACKLYRDCCKQSVQVCEDRRKGFGQYLSSLTDSDTFEGPDSFEPRTVTYSQGRRMACKRKLQFDSVAARPYCAMSGSPMVIRFLGFSDEYNSS
jgi:hypothetical protein